MLSTLTIVNIFSEIFAAGFLLAGVIVFIKNYFSYKKTKDFFFALIFLSLFVYVATTIISQMMFNLGREVSELILVNKIIYVSIVLCSIFVWAFLVERFDLTKLRWSNGFLIGIGGLIIYRILASTVNLIYREGIIEPIVDFSLFVPAKQVFALMWLALALFAFFSAIKSKGGRRTLTMYLASSAVAFLFVLLFSFLYVRFGEPGYLVASWSLILLASLGFLLAELIPMDSFEARQPLRFFRTRLLFKLLLIFVLLIGILFETTTLATINISKDALSKVILSNYSRAAEDVAEEIESSSGEPSLVYLQMLLAKARIKGQGVVFLVDQEGRLISHPDSNRAIQKEDFSGNQAVRQILKKVKGEGEFRDELGSLMVGAYVPINKFGWGVVAQEPM